jgi:hypothetical protein
MQLRQMRQAFQSNGFALTSRSHLYLASRNLTMVCGFQFQSFASFGSTMREQLQVWTGHSLANFHRTDALKCKIHIFLTSASSSRNKIRRHSPHRKFR